MKEPPVKTGIGRQLQIYLVSILLPPLGLFPGIKYLLQKERKAQIIGLVAIIITIIASIVTIWFSIEFFNQVSGTLNSQLYQLQGAGY